MREKFPKIIPFEKMKKTRKREKTNLTIVHHNMVMRENLSYLSSILFENLTFIFIENCLFLLRGNRERILAHRFSPTIRLFAH